MNVSSDVNLPNSNYRFPYFLIGDAAFPSKPNLMKPFPKVTDTEKYVYNKKTLKMCPENARKIVIPSMVLHNILRYQMDQSITFEEITSNKTGSVALMGMILIQPMYHLKTRFPTELYNEITKIIQEIKKKTIRTSLSFNLFIF